MVAEKIHLPAGKIDAYELSYQSGSMAVDATGKILSKQTKKALRAQLGFCITCPEVPVKLFDIKRSKMNPLRATKKALFLEGECEDGWCIRCRGPYVKPDGDDDSENGSLSSPANPQSRKSRSMSRVRSRSRARSKVRSRSRRNINEESPQSSKKERDDSPSRRRRARSKSVGRGLRNALVAVTGRGKSSRSVVDEPKSSVSEDTPPPPPPPPDDSSPEIGSATQISRKNPASVPSESKSSQSDGNATSPTNSQSKGSDTQSSLESSNDQKCDSKANATHASPQTEPLKKNLTSRSSSRSRNSTNDSLGTRSSHGTPKYSRGTDPLRSQTSHVTSRYLRNVDDLQSQSSHSTSQYQPSRVAGRNMSPQVRRDQLRKSVSVANRRSYSVTGKQADITNQASVNRRSRSVAGNYRDNPVYPSPGGIYSGRKSAEDSSESSMTEKVVPISLDALIADVSARGRRSVPLESTSSDRSARGRRSIPLESTSRSSRGSRSVPIESTSSDRSARGRRSIGVEQLLADASSTHSSRGGRSIAAESTSSDKSVRRHGSIDFEPRKADVSTNHSSRGGRSVPLESHRADATTNRSMRADISTNLSSRGRRSFDPLASGSNSQGSSSHSTRGSRTISLGAHLSRTSHGGSRPLSSSKSVDMPLSQSLHGGHSTSLMNTSSSYDTSSLSGQNSKNDSWRHASSHGRYGSNPQRSGNIGSNAGKSVNSGQQTDCGNGTRRGVFRGASCESLMSISSCDDIFEEEDFEDSNDTQISHEVNRKPQDKTEAMITSLEGFFSDMKAAGDAELISEVIFSSMTSNPDIEKIQAYCIRTLVEVLSAQNQDFQFLFRINGHDRLLSVMKDNPSSLDIHQSCFKAFEILAKKESSCSALIEIGICDVIDRALQHFLGEEALAESAINILRNLSFEKEGAAALVRLGMVNKVVEVMYCTLSTAPIQNDGCALLCNLSVDEENQRVSEVDASILSVIVAAMQANRDSPEVLASACFALKNLTRQEANLRELSRTKDVDEALRRSRIFSVSEADSRLLLERIQISIAEDRFLEEQICNSLKASVDAEPNKSSNVADVIDALQNYQWSERTAFTCVEILRSLVEQSEDHRHRLAERDYLQKLENCAESNTHRGGFREDTLSLIRLVSNVP